MNELEYRQYNRFGWKCNNNNSIQCDFKRPVIRASDWKKENKFQKSFTRLRKPLVDNSDFIRYLKEIIRREVVQVVELKKSASEETLTEHTLPHLESTVKFIKTIADIDRFLTMERKLQDLENKLDILLRILHDNILPKRIPIESESKLTTKVNFKTLIQENEYHHAESVEAKCSLVIEKELIQNFLTRHWMLDIFLARSNTVTKFLKSVPIMQWCPPYPLYLMRNIGLSKVI